MVQAAPLSKTVNPTVGSSQFKPEDMNPMPEIAGANSTADKQGYAKRSTKKGQLLIECTREFTQIKRPQQSEVQQFKELFYQLVGQLSVPDRRLMSAMLARQNFTPRPIALYFAHDLLEIAAPFLLFSPVLTDLDLQVIASKKGSSFIDVIKKRNLPMEPFTAAKLNNAPVLNRDSDLSTLKPAKSPVTVEQTNRPGTEPSSQTDQAPMLKAEKVFAPAKPLSGEEIVALASVGGRLGKSETPKPVPDTRIYRNHDNPAEAERSFDTLPKRETAELLKLARNRDHEGFAKLVEDICGLGTTATLRLIRVSGSSEMLYLIKALGIASPKDMQLALLLSPSTGRSIVQFNDAKTLMSDIDTGICRMIFNEIGARFPLGEKIGEPITGTANESGFGSAARRRREAISTQNHRPRQNANPVRATG